MPLDLGKDIVSYGSLPDAATVKSTCRWYHHLVASMPISYELQQRKAFKTNLFGNFRFVSTNVDRLDEGEEKWISAIASGEYLAHLFKD